VNAWNESALTVISLEAISSHSSIEQMASDYIAEIRSIQSAGPYFLGGASSGGTVALEIAQQLTGRVKRYRCLCCSTRLDQENVVGVLGGHQ
jgi:thioesterase domain-containing protein